MKIIFEMQEITKAILYRVLIGKFVAHEEAKIYPAGKTKQNAYVLTSHVDILEFLSENRSSRALGNNSGY